MYNETTRLVKVVMPDYGQDEPPVNGGGNFPILNSVNPTRAAGSAGTSTDSGAIMLSDTAENLFIAYEVVAMVKDETTGKTHFSQLKWKRLGTVEEEDGGDAKSVADPSGDGEQIGPKGAMRSDAGTSDDDTSDDEQLVYQFMFESGDLFVAAAADEYPALYGDELQMLSDSSSGGGSGGSGGGGAVAHATYTIDETTQEPASIVLDMTVDEIIAAEGNVSVVANLGSPNHTFIAVGRVVEINGTAVSVIGIPDASLDDYYTALTVFADTDGHGHPAWYASGGVPK